MALRFLSVMLLLGVASLLHAADPKEQAKKDLAAVQAYLAKEYPKKKWAVGPARLDSPVLQQAYPDRRFYYVYTAAPLPPGAFNRQLIDAYQKRMQDFRDNYITVTLSLDNQGAISPLKTPGDYNNGLIAVKTDAAARIACAAILSLSDGSNTCPEALTAGEIQLENSAKGWQGRIMKRNKFQGTVQLNPEGKCIGVTRLNLRPLPP